MGSTPVFTGRRDGGRLVATGQAVCDLGWRREVAGFDGLHAGWRWDGKLLEAWTDEYGFYPLFYCATPTRIMVSGSLVALLDAGAPDELDEDAVTVFAYTGFYPGEMTAYRHIKVLPPGGRLRWDGGVSITSRPLTFAEHATLTRDQAIDAYIDVFSAAVRRSLPSGDFVLPLSGGKDSRHILLELCRLGRLPAQCLTLANRPSTWNNQPNEDVAVARIVTERLDVPHLVIDQNGHRLARERKKNTLTHRLTDEHGWLMPLRPLVEQFGHAYDGIGGGVLSAGSFLGYPGRVEMYEWRDFAAVAETICRKGAYITELVPAQVQRRRGDVVAWVAQELERHEGAANPIGSFFFWNRTRRAIALWPCCGLGSVAAVRTPFLDPEVFGLLSTLPMRILNAGFHRDAIRRAYPDHADLPYRADAGAANSLKRHRAFARSLALPSLAPGRMTRATFLAPRVARCLVDPSYAPTIEALGPSATYLMQLSSGTTPT